MRYKSLLLVLSLSLIFPGLANSLPLIKTMMAKNTQQSDMDFTAYINNQANITVDKIIEQQVPFSISFNVMVPANSENPYPYTKVYVADIKSVSANEVEISMPRLAQRTTKICLNVTQKDQPDILIKPDSSEIIINPVAITIKNCSS